MLNNIRKQTKGFTIIEVLIVLAIAGLILLVVFLAVPALQRNARNNEARNEASRFATAANEFVTNSGGSYPSATTVATVQTAAGTTRQLTSLSYATADAAPAANSAILSRGTCGGAGGTSIVYSATARTQVVKYALEPAGTVACVQI